MIFLIQHKIYQKTRIIKNEKIILINQKNDLKNTKINYSTLKLKCRSRPSSPT